MILFPLHSVCVKRINYVYFVYCIMLLLNHYNTIHLFIYFFHIKMTFNYLFPHCLQYLREWLLALYEAPVFSYMQRYWLSAHQHIRRKKVRISRLPLPVHVSGGELVMEWAGIRDRCTLKLMAKCHRIITALI